MARGKAKGKSLRKEVVSNMMGTLAGSVFAQMVLLTVLVVSFAVIEGYYITLIIPLIVAAWTWRSIAFEVFLLMHVIEDGLGTWQWYSKIDNRLYLGGIPMNSLNHLSHLTLDHKVDAVLSVMESYEISSRTLAGQPVQPSQWKKEDVIHKQLYAYDFFPPSHKVLHEGADWIKRQLDDKRVIYCHCKSGKGRSTSVVAAYYIKYKGMSALNALSFIRKIRPTIISDSSPQTKNLMEFENSLKGDRAAILDP